VVVAAIDDDVWTATFGRQGNGSLQYRPVPRLPGPICRERIVVERADLADLESALPQWRERSLQSVANQPIGGDGHTFDALLDGDVQRIRASIYA
jgi:hypothetical protein